MRLKKHCYMPTVTEEIKREHSELYGLLELMLELANTACLTHSLWVPVKSMELN